MMYMEFHPLHNLDLIKTKWLISPFGLFVFAFCKNKTKNGIFGLHNRLE